MSTKVKTVGGLAVLPKEIPARLDLDLRKIAAMEKIMHNYRDALRRLAE